MRVLACGPGYDRGGSLSKVNKKTEKKLLRLIFLTMISLVPFLLSSSSKVSRGHIRTLYAIGTKYGKMKKIDGWDQKHGKFFPFFCLSQMVLNTKKKQREHIELRQAQNARFSPPASGAVEKKEHGRRYQNDASRRRRREEWKN